MLALTSARSPSSPGHSLADGPCSRSQLGGFPRGDAFAAWSSSTEQRMAEIFDFGGHPWGKKNMWVSSAKFLFKKKNG